MKSQFVSKNRSRNRLRAAIALALAGSTFGVAGPSLAAESAVQGGLEEVTVTATRRETNLQATPLAVSAISAETVRVVARRGPTTISQTRHGLVMAAAGVDESNTEPGTLVLLGSGILGLAGVIRRKLSL